MNDSTCADTTVKAENSTDPVERLKRLTKGCGRYGIEPGWLGRLMDSDCVRLLSYLIGASQCHGYGPQSQTGDGWFFRSRTQIEEDLGLSECQQKRTLAKLKRLDGTLVQWEQRGRVRYFRIDLDALDALEEMSHYARRKQKSCRPRSSDAGRKCSVLPQDAGHFRPASPTEAAQDAGRKCPATDEDAGRKCPATDEDAGRKCPATDEDAGRKCPASYIDEPEEDKPEYQTHSRAGGGDAVASPSPRDRARGEADLPDVDEKATAGHDAPSRPDEQRAEALPEQVHTDAESPPRPDSQVVQCSSDTSEVTGGQPMRPEDYARRLHAALSARRLLKSRKSNLIAWANTFADLLTELGADEVRPVFEWYLEHMGEEYVPEADSARGFADKFGRIKRQMERRSRAAPCRPALPDHVVGSNDMTDEDRALVAKIVRRVCNQYTWPFGLESEVPELVERSYAAAKELFDRLEPLAKLGRKWPFPRMGGPLWKASRGADVFTAYCGGPADLLERWLEQLHARTLRWSAPYELKPLAYLDKPMKQFMAVVLHGPGYDDCLNDLIGQLPDGGAALAAELALLGPVKVIQMGAGRCG